MSKKNLISFLGLLFIASVVGCQKSAVIENTHWRTEEGTSPPSVLQSESIKNAKVTYKDLDVTIGEQNVFGASVSGSYSKIVLKDQSLSRVDFSYLKNPSPLLRTDALVMGKVPQLFRRTLEYQHPEVKSLRLVSQSLKIATPQNEPPQVVWEFVFLNHLGAMSSFQVNKYYVSSEIESQYSCFFESQAQLYPLGPLKSSLSVVTIDKLLSSEALVSEGVRLTPLAPLFAKPENNRYQFPQDDPRFFQIHAFHYIDQSFRWFEQNLNFKIPQQISVETSIGYPDKTNAAFYFNKVIRLGDGDDVAFSNLPLDPSISTHESIHAIVDSVAKLPFQGQGGSINEAFADFFTAHILNNPHLGEVAYKKAPFKRTVDNPKKFQDLSGGLYADSAVLSGLLWQIRVELGPLVAQELAWKLLLMSHPETQFTDLKTNLKYLVENMPHDIKIRTQQILRDRGWD
jgi:hypothetical protein